MPPAAPAAAAATQPVLGRARASRKSRLRRMEALRSGRWTRSRTSYATGLRRPVHRPRHPPDVTQVRPRPTSAGDSAGGIFRHPPNPSRTVTTFLKTTEIPIDGARTLPARVLHLARHPGPGDGADLPPALDLRRAGGPDPQPGRLLPPGDRQGERHRPARPRGRLPGVLQRLPPPRHPALRGAHRPVLRDHPVPLPRLDLRPRRPADRRALHRRHRGLRQGRLAAAPRWPSRPGKGSSSSTWPSSPSRSRRPSSRCSGRFSRFNLPNLKVAPHHRLRRALQLEAAVPELLGVLPLRAGPSRRWPSSPRPPAARTT